jgi:O-antigen/teichoic acid export membrane protein
MYAPTWLRKTSSEKLYVNSTYLLLNSAVLGGLGFVFWTICTHLYPAAQIGIATALLAALNLITSLSLLGFEISIIRVLPKHTDKNNLVNTVLSIAGGLGFVFAVLFIYLQPHIAGSLSIIHKNIWYILLFTFYTAFSVASYILESVFVSYREAKYIFRKNTIFSIAKICLVFAFISLGAFGIYSAWMIGLGLAVLYSFVTLMRQFNHRFKVSLDHKSLKGMKKYSAGNYVASFIEGLPVMVLPLVVTTIFGVTMNAYYYMAMTFASFIFTISVSATQSLFAEGSHTQVDIWHKTLKTAKYVGIFMLPCILGVLILGHPLLLIFGEAYAAHASTLLDILAISAIPFSANTIARTILQIGYSVKKLVIIDIIGTIPIFALISPLQHIGIDAVGLTWLIGQCVMLVLFSYTIVLDRRSLLATTA